MEISVFTVDAFTNLPFKGNPAAVCPLLHELSDDLYQKIATEMNLAETAFITKINPSDNFTTGSRFRLRWFTPTNEVNLCGHATLASAAVLFQSKKNENSVLVFETRSGDLAVTQQGERYIMDFPLNPPAQEVHYVSVYSLCCSGKSPNPDVYLCSNTKKLMVRLADSCDSLLYLSIGSPDCQPGYDFYSRYFSPWNGIPEDPVTGRPLLTAHTNGHRQTIFSMPEITTTGSVPTRGAE
uniref:Phenazine biosynthesis like protein domain containing n=1 Tax=Labrus bergylta TaxID=56723 RepID=A0A3Q3E572_9LABR